MGAALLGVTIIIWLFKLLFRIAGGVFRIAAGCINSGQRNRARRTLAERRNAARIEKERAATVERAARLEYMRRREIDRKEQALKREAERAEKERAKRAAADRKKQFEKATADNDIAHYEITREDLQRLYTTYERQYNTAKSADKAAAAYRKMIAINNQLRAVDRKIERAQYILAG